MELLDVSGNQFGDEGALSFLSCLGNISNLIMHNCGITKEGFLKFSEAYENNSDAEVIFCPLYFHRISFTKLTLKI